MQLVFHIPSTVQQFRVTRNTKKYTFLLKWHGELDVDKSNDKLIKKPKYIPSLCGGGQAFINDK